MSIWPSINRETIQIIAWEVSQVFYNSRTRFHCQWRLDHKNYES
jgi:hypothetical protein